MAVHAYNASIQESEAEDCEFMATSWVWGQPGLCSETLSHKHSKGRMPVV
jgi:hypothetical protein